jgi:hypothetical protein
MFINYQVRSLSGGFAQALFSKLLSSVRILVWIWPLLLAWGARLYSRGLGSGRERYANLFLIIFLLSAVVSKGTSNGFPKYHSAVLPLLCALGGAYLTGVIAKGAAVRASLLMAAAVFGSWVLIAAAGDPIYTLNYSLRAALISASGVSEPFMTLLMQSGVALAAAAGLYYASAKLIARRSAAALSVLGLALIWNTAVGFSQARADYFTTYGYGTRGKSEAVAWLATHRGGQVFGPNEFDWELRVAGVPFKKVSDYCISNNKCVLGILRDPQTGFFIFGQASNTVEQVRSFLGFTERDIGRPFKSIKIGDFWIYSLEETVYEH